MKEFSSKLQMANSSRFSKVKKIERNREVVTQRSFEWEIVGIERENIGKIEVGARLSCLRSVSFHVS